MGYSTYSSTDRVYRAKARGYTTIDASTTNTVFEQNVKQMIHEGMQPKGVVIRESVDSEAHPNTVPIQLYLDVTGSMGEIPRMLIKDGLPTLMSTLIQNGVPDASLMFGAIGDHECDRAPIQVAQFESGDAELDMWLTRTWLEGKGGGNAGESYLLAWYFAANHIKTDAFDKRNKKGFVFTIGDEPCLINLPKRAITEIMGDSGIAERDYYSREELLAKAQEKNHVFHIHVNHGNRRCDPSWNQMFGDNLIIVTDFNTIPKVISETILANMDSSELIFGESITVVSPETKTEEEIKITL